jgi:protein phosphatase methylesterase 1
MRAQIRAMLAAAALGGAVSGHAETPHFTITDDPGLDRAVADARAEFLRDKTFSRLDATILVANPDGTWRRGSFNPEVINYPASCVKLPYMAAAMNWCREKGLPYTALDHCVRPMIEKSDNVQTGVVVDAITSTTNDETITTAADPRFDAWYRRRLYTENYLRARGLLENQVIIHKTYPTNSGEMPSGAEKAAREFRGMNKMQPRASASLMLEIAKGAL